MKSALNKILILSILTAFITYSSGILVVKHFCLSCKIENSSFFIHDACEETDHSHSATINNNHSESLSCCQKIPLKGEAQFTSLCCVDDITFLKIIETFKISENLTDFNQDIFSNNYQELIIQSLKLIKHCYKFKLPPNKIPLNNLIILFSKFTL